MGAERDVLKMLAQRGDARAAGFMRAAVRCAIRRDHEEIRMIDPDELGEIPQGIVDVRVESPWDEPRNSTEDLVHEIVREVLPPQRSFGSLARGDI